jgi:ribonuclease HI
MKLDLIRHAVDQTCREQDREIQVLICSDLNRHDTLWGGYAALRDRYRSNEAEEILEFAAEYGMQSLLPPGTTTWEHQTQDHCSTVDVILATAGLAGEVIRCGIHPADHGSDHSAIDIIIGTAPQRYPQRAGRRMYETADWEKIRLELEQSLQAPPDRHRLRTTEDMEREADGFMQRVLTQIEQWTSRAKPSPYAKRWWTPTLTTLRQAMTSIRNRVVTLRRRGQDTTEAKARLRTAKQMYFQEIEKQKKAHWREFLDDPNNIWKANTYTKLANTGTTIPNLQKGQQTASKDEDKAKLLMDTFFPVPLEPEETHEPHTHREREQDQTGAPQSVAKVTLEEIRHAIWRANPKKAPGEDEITFKVWRELWPVVGEWLLALFQASIRLSHLPRSWRTAKIVALRKPGKRDYTAPKAYRPISLLPTISKILETIVARRLSYLAEQYHLLPDNHLGGRPRRSAEQAVDVLIDRIHEAWRGRRVLSLVTFDVQGAFNGVHPEVLCKRLQERHIPTQLVNWIRNFCSERTGTVVVGQYTSETVHIQHAGIPQGSPLSPILYIFYNANLVEQKINTRKGSVGFIDDFTAWVTGDTAEANTRELQQTIIPKAEDWARKSGATFETDKTGFIHFSKQPGKLSNRPGLVFNGTQIKDTEAVKILGVILDQKLAMDAHVERVTTAATIKCLALARLKGLRPKQLRELYRSIVVPTTDYAASSWFSQDRRGTVRLIHRMQKVQKLGAKIILRAFRGVAAQVLDAEANLEPVQERLTRKMIRHVANLGSLPADNPLQQNTRQKQTRGATWQTPIQQTWQAFKERYNPKKGKPPTPLRPWLLPPWKDRTSQCIILSEGEARDMIHNEHQSGTTVLYTDASVRNGVSGCATVEGNGIGPIRMVFSATIGWARTCSVLSAELQAIKLAIECLVPVRFDTQTPIIATDSQEALRVIAQGNAARKGREALQGIHDSLVETERHGLRVRLVWTPGHRNILGNELAHRAAQDTTKTGSKPTRDLTLRIRENKAVRDLAVKDYQQQMTAKHQQAGLGPWGKYTQRLDGALPGKHTLKLYGALNADQASVLVQARTNHTHLRSHLARIGAERSARCECGQENETVEHVLVRCPRWTEMRTKLKEAAGNRWADLSYLLGGYSRKRELRTGEPVDGALEKWTPNLEIVKLTIQFLQQTARMEAHPIQQQEGQSQE